MAQKKQPSADPVTEPKKRRRVSVADVDAGVEAKDCIKIYLVSSKEEVGVSDSFCINPVDLNSFFDEDGKIYGYQELKITVWVSMISFHSYADITFKSTSDRGKGITDLKSALQSIFAETLVESKDDFLQTFSTETHFIRSAVSTGEVIQHKASNEHSHVEQAVSDLEVVRMVVGNMATGHLYSCLVPLVLLLVDGSNPIDVTDPRWELYLLIQKKEDQQGDIQNRLLGFTALYRFYHYPDSTRIRLSQILILPPYQRKGYGSYLVEVLSNVAIAENVYDFTVEEPLDSFQHVRTCVDIKHLLAFEPIRLAINSAVLSLKEGKLSKKIHAPQFVPPLSAVDDVRKTLKINKKQFLQCWEILIYLSLGPADKCIEDYFTIISNRVRADILGKDSGTAGKRLIDVPTTYDQETSFVMFRSKDSEPSSVQMDTTETNQEQQLQQLVDLRIKEIKLIAQKVSLGCALSVTAKE
ncbi:histone acetyltransferase type B catalytic subunit-like isoform X1 [Mangifera indica]|uniref:histone acetyltransferase type B catalytic subunit-like isoform X1 n=1 Tax=Mangifera indica TaxID=29780 RepID=UPI001CFA3EB5|nr:histone acetyltransferase type B catalytic subunit-like isoform X1 [Mangifera indica]